MRQPVRHIAINVAVCRRAEVWYDMKFEAVGGMVISGLGVAWLWHICLGLGLAVGVSQLAMTRFYQKAGSNDNHRSARAQAVQCA